MSSPRAAPTTLELVEAVRTFLQRDVTNVTRGRTHVEARAAARLLAVVERQLRSGDTYAASHAERLAAVGYASDAELAAAIRSGACDDRWDEVTAAVRDAVADQLAVTNPDYAATDT